MGGDLSLVFGFEYSQYSEKFLFFEDDSRTERRNREKGFINLSEYVISALSPL